jgi:hypothetical protein
MESAPDDDLDLDEVEGQTPRTGKRSPMDRLRSSLQAPDVDIDASDGSTKWAVDRLDGREKRFTFIAAGGAVVFGVTTYLVESNKAGFTPHKGQLSPFTTLVGGLVCGVLLFGSVFLGRRAPVGFVSVLTGLFFSNVSFPLAIPFIGLGAWILFRSYKIQKDLTTKVRAARAEAPPQAARSRTSPPTSRGGTGRSKSQTPSTPEANKRYTPKRPPPPPPKPSRRDRKAAKSAE